VFFGGEFGQRHGIQTRGYYPQFNGGENSSDLFSTILKEAALKPSTVYARISPFIDWVLRVIGYSLKPCLTAGS